MFEDFDVVLVENNQDFRDYISQNHYTQSSRTNSVFCFYLLDPNKKRVGAISYGPFGRYQSQVKYKDHIELTRVYIENHIGKNAESFLIGKTLEYIKKNSHYLGVISYADPTVGHKGTIYKASNFDFIGYTSLSYHYEINNYKLNAHSVWKRAKKNERTEKQQSEIEKLKRVNHERKLVFLYSFKRKINPKNTIKISEDKRLLKFFNCWSREMAWIYGLILGDGHVEMSKEYAWKIHLLGEKDTLEKVVKILKVSNNIQYRRGIHQMYFHSRSIVNWFRSRGITAQKKYSVKYPDDMPTRFKWDFLRGLIEADGIFNWSNPKNWGGRGNEYLNLGYSSANEEFCKRIKLELEVENSITHHQKLLNDKIHHHYSFRCNSKKSIEILNQIYNCHSHIRDEDRYQKYLKGKALMNHYQSLECIQCGEKVYSQDLCFTHLMDKKREEKREENQCSIPGCTKPYHGKGYCMEHLWEQKKKENPYHQKEIGLKIQALRLKNQVSQTQLSHVIGHKGQGHLSNVEKAKSFISEENLKKIADFFKLPIEFFLDPKRNLETCIHPDCQEKSTQEYYCQAHYEESKKKKPRKQNCVIEGCSKLRSKKQYCARHYRERTGIAVNKVNPCLYQEKGCQSQAYQNGLCKFHIQYRALGGDQARDQFIQARKNLNMDKLDFARALKITPLRVELIEKGESYLEKKDWDKFKELTGQSYVQI